MSRTVELVARFDADKSGWLDAEEREKARTWLKENPQGGRRPGGPGRGRRPPGGFPGGEEAAAPKMESHRVAPDTVATFPKQGLYDPTILRTFFIDFPQENWEEELAAFYRTDVDVPARLTVDGKVHEGVGISFRGNSSYFGLGSAKKKSINVVLDTVNSKQRLGGYKTLNLLNAHTDPSFLREFLFSHIAGHYFPAPKVNLVKLVINGESYGIYVNAQQFNTDFLRDWFGTRKGVRWKVPPNFGGGGALVGLGPDLEPYKSSYQLKTKSADTEATWRSLQGLCEALSTTRFSDLEATVPLYLNVDEVLWFLAVDNVFMDGDGYFSRGSDYAIYRDRKGIFHALPHDSNETFRSGGGGPGGARVSGLRLDPLAEIDNPDRPLVNLLKVPAWRARYLAHVKTLVDRWLDWNRIGPLVQRMHDLIDAEVKRDDKALYGYASFAESLEAKETEAPRGRNRAEPLRAFVEGRAAYLREHAALEGSWPRIRRVMSEMTFRDDGAFLEVTTHVEAAAQGLAVVLHYSLGAGQLYREVVLKDDGQHGDGQAGDGIFGGKTPALPAKDKVRFYVEARTREPELRSNFYPEEAEAAPKVLPTSKR